MLGPRPQGQVPNLQTCMICDIYSYAWAPTGRSSPEPTNLYQLIFLSYLSYCPDRKQKTTPQQADKHRCNNKRGTVLFVFPLTNIAVSP